MIARHQIRLIVALVHSLDIISMPTILMTRLLLFYCVERGYLHSNRLSWKLLKGWREVHLVDHSDDSIHRRASSRASRSTVVLVPRRGPGPQRKLGSNLNWSLWLHGWQPITHGASLTYSLDRLTSLSLTTSFHIHITTKN